MRHIPKFKRNLSGALAILCLGIASSLHAQTIELNDDLEVLNFIKPLADVRAARDALSEQYQCGDTAYPGSEPSIAGMDGFDELRCGLALAKGGKMERAAELLKTAIARFPEDSPAVLRVASNYTLGYVLASRRTDTAARHFDVALEAAEQGRVTNRERMGDMAFTAGLRLYWRGSRRNPERFFMAALRHYNDSSVKRAVRQMKAAKSSFWIGRFALWDRDLVRAEQHLRPSAEYFRSWGRRSPDDYQIISYTAMVELYERLGDDLLALEFALLAGQLDDAEGWHRDEPLYMPEPGNLVRGNRQDLTGSVTFKFQINEMGRAQDILLISLDGRSELRSPARWAISQARFAVPHEKGAPVTREQEYEVVFNYVRSLSGMSQSRFSSV